MTGSQNRSLLISLIAGHVVLWGLFSLAALADQYVNAIEVIWVANLQELVATVTRRSQLILLAFWMVFGPSGVAVRSLGAMGGVTLMSMIFVIPWLAYVPLSYVAFPVATYTVIIPFTSASLTLIGLRLWGWRLTAIEPARMPVDNRHRFQFSIRLLIGITLAVALLSATLPVPVMSLLGQPYLGGDKWPPYLFRVLVVVPLVAAGAAKLFQSERFGWRQIAIWLAVWVGLEQTYLLLVGFPVPIIVRWKNTTILVAAGAVVALSLWCIRRAGYRLVSGPRSPAR